MHAYTIQNKKILSNSLSRVGYLIIDCLISNEKVIAMAVLRTNVSFYYLYTILYTIYITHYSQRLEYKCFHKTDMQEQVD